MDAVVISSQHQDSDDRDSFTKKIRSDIFEHVIRPVVPSELLDDNTRYFVNPSGWFAVGGPQGDTGLTGRKILVDTYGGIARHGGGAFSGKDPTKVDRSGAYAARYVAKNLVAAGLAQRVEVIVSYAIGVASPSPYPWKHLIPATSPMTGSRRWLANTSTCAPVQSSRTLTCAAPSTSPRPLMATSAALRPRSWASPGK